MEDQYKTSQLYSTILEWHRKKKLDLTVVPPLILKAEVAHLRAPVAYNPNLNRNLNPNLNPNSVR